MTSRCPTCERQAGGFEWDSSLSRVWIVPSGWRRSVPPAGRRGRTGGHSADRVGRSSGWAITPRTPRRSRFCFHRGAPLPNPGRVMRLNSASGRRFCGPFCRSGHLQGLVGAMVVSPCPVVDRRLGVLTIGKNLSRGNSVFVVLWNRSVMPVVVGERGAVRRAVILFSRQICSNSALPGPDPPPAGEHGSNS